MHDGQQGSEEMATASRCLHDGTQDEAGRAVPLGVVAFTQRPRPRGT